MKDTSNELLQLVDKDDNIIGAVMRSAAKQNPELTYRVSALYVINKDRQILAAQRSTLKPDHAGSWKFIALAGHVGATEDPQIAIIRETQEELGIKIEPQFFKKRFKKTSKFSRYSYIYYIEVGEVEFVLDDDEIEQIMWIDFDDIEAAAESFDISKNKLKEVNELIAAL